jgi:hypothetical protein
MFQFRSRRSSQSGSSRPSRSAARPSDRRATERIPLDVLANRFLDGYPYLCRATDISRHGMRLRRFNEPTSNSQFVGLQFQLPGSDDVITASGEIVSRDEGRRALGIRFTHLAPNAAAAIDRFLARAAS